MNKLSFNFFRTLLWLWDIISLNLVLFFTSFFIARADAINQKEYHLYFAVFNLCWMISVYLTALYMSKNWLDFESFFKRTLKCFMLTTSSIFLFIFLYHYQFSRFFILVCFAGFALILTINRIIFNLLVMFIYLI